MTDARERLVEVMLTAMSEHHSGNFAEAQRIVDAILAAIEAAGVRLMPSEATEEMQLAAMNDFSGHMNGADVRCLYRAMLAASPYAQKEQTHESD